MYDGNYFLTGLRHQVRETGGDAIVTVVLHSGGSFYVRDVFETHPGYVMLNIWHGSGGKPIVAPSSDAYSQEIPEGYHPMSVAFESISTIDVMPTSEEERRRIGFII
ncbi:MAG: hypothetical protein AMS17_01030 [Spirochaetes bacterium DG_61]|jgi:hypothetical protein|nr:MAG: hypothetical protein AMS17_01030 [Spirochaetes bacterium DG_61]